MIESTRFVAYHAPCAPAGRQWQAQIFNTPAPTASKPNPGEVPFNMSFWGSSRDDCLAKAEAWWAAETGKAAAREANIVTRTERAKATRAAKLEASA
ncbi:hypothetical protein ACLNGM_14890 [Aureimonas phyllosphaerae]|uniref:hypothetical protein n=1 Tax=Aureimonas phyllosphaerae TaxID=1166078 RepID=UPI003A5C55CD